MDDLRHQQFFELERRYWDAMKNEDGASAATLSADPTIVVGAQGLGELPRQALEGMIAQASWKLLDYELEDVHVREAAPDAVIVAYKVTEKLEVDGQALTLVAHDASVWVKEDDHWVCPLHTESLAGDPFGRDKTRG